MTWFQFTGQNIQLLPENWDPFQYARDNARRTKESAYRGSYWLNYDDVFKHQKETKATVKWNQLSYWKTKNLLLFQESKVNIKGKCQLQRKAEYNRIWLVLTHGSVSKPRIKSRNCTKNDWSEPVERDSKQCKCRKISNTGCFNDDRPGQYYTIVG